MLSGPTILRISILVIVAGLIAALVQFLVPTPSPPVGVAEPAAPPETSVSRPPVETIPAVTSPAPSTESSAPSRPESGGTNPTARFELPSDTLAFPSAPRDDRSASVPAAEEEIHEAEQTAPPRALAVVDLNTASTADLNRLRGGGSIGRAIAAKRPYTSVEQLLSKRVLSRSVYDRIKDQVTVR